MANFDGEERNYRLGRLTAFQTGILFLLIASAILIFVLYQLHTGQVFTKMGDIPLHSGMGWAWISIESIGAGAGIVRGLRMIRAD